MERDSVCEWTQVGSEGTEGQGGGAGNCSSWTWSEFLPSTSMAPPAKQYMLLWAAISVQTTETFYRETERN
jgi:hypothetical protein